jgi:hypothetical protein
MRFSPLGWPDWNTKDRYTKETFHPSYLFLYFFDLYYLYTPYSVYCTEYPLNNMCREPWSALLFMYHFFIFETVAQEIASAL